MNAPGGPSTTPDDPVIRLDHVSRVYQVGESEVRALDDVTLSIERGDFVAIMGPSGSGKSTMLNVLGCLDTPTSGSYVLDGQRVENLTQDQLAEVRQKRIGFVFQSYHLISRMTAARNVELPMIFAGTDPRERRERVRKAIDSVGLTPHRPPPRPASGGERQRVAIARAMVMQPSILSPTPTGNPTPAPARRSLLCWRR